MSANSSISRRDFLKAAGTLPLGLGLASALRPYQLRQPLTGDQKNVLIVVFDAFSARHMSLYGYARETTPNMARLAERAIVYNNHYAASCWTTPGTASLFTGALPWSHRAMGIQYSVSPDFFRKTIFRAFNDYHRVVYSHSHLVYNLCDDFAKDLDAYVPRGNHLLTGHGAFDDLFARDRDAATLVWALAFEGASGDAGYSLFLSHLRWAYIQRRIERFLPYFPLGVPRVENIAYFVLEDAIDWLEGQAGRFPQPFLGYVHLFPPHDPSAPPEDFYRYFARDGYRPLVKPVHPLAPKVSSDVQLLREHREYDEYILYVDREFGRLFDHLESSGALEDTWIILTSDHGELFERGFRGHAGPLLYESVLRVPLMIFEPGRTTRLDVHTPTSAVDLLPTMLHVTGHDPVDWTDGFILPPFVPPQADRPIFAVYSEGIGPRMPLEKAAAVVIKDGHKLMYIFGYPKLGAARERVELYDLAVDPEELHNLYGEEPGTGAALLALLKGKLREVNEPYL